MHAEAARPLGHDWVVLAGAHVEALALECGDELVLAESVRVGDHAMVGHDRELTLREEDAEKVVVGVRARCLIVCLHTHLLADAGGGGGAMVTVGDVGAGDIGEHHAERLDRRRAGDAPHGLAHVLLVGEAVEGACAHGGGDERLECLVVLIGEVDGAGLAARGLDVADAVELLLGMGELVALDHAAGVVVERTGGDDAHLRVVALHQAVEVVAGSGVAKERAVGDSVAEELGGLGVDLGRIHVVVGRKRGLGSVDGEERRGMVGHVGGSLLAVEDVVGEGGELSRTHRTGPIADEWLHAHIKGSSR